MVGRDPFGPVTDKWLLAFGNDRGKLLSCQTCHGRRNQNRDLDHVCLLWYGCVMKRYATFLKEDQIAKLKKLFVKKGIRPAEAIRRAIDAYLKAQGIKK